MNRRLFNAAACVWVIAVSGSASASKGEPQEVLENILRQALRENPAVLAARLEMEGADARAGSADRLPDPTLGVGYSPVALETRGGPQRARASIEQAFPFFGKRGLRREVAEAEAGIAGRRVDITASEVIGSVKDSFWEIYRVDRAIETAEKEAFLLAEIVEAADAKYATGSGQQSNLLQAQLMSTVVSNRLILLRGDRQAAVERLAGWVGAPTEVPPLPETDVLPLLLDREEILARARDASPEAAARRAEVRRARLAAALVRKDFYPDFALSLGWSEVGENDMPGEWNGRDAWSVGAMVKIPLYRGDLRDREMGEEKSLEAAERRLDDALLLVEANVDDLLRRLRAAAESIDLYRTGLIPQAMSTYESAMAAYSTGELGFADLLVAERSLLEVELGRHETIARYEKMLSRLERVLGARDSETLFPLRIGG
ncbi:MAG: TolC family protein [Candidatus Eisenbacteria bacterium]